MGRGILSEFLRIQEQEKKNQEDFRDFFLSLFPLYDSFQLLIIARGHVFLGLSRKPILKYFAPDTDTGRLLSSRQINSYSHLIDKSLAPINFSCSNAIYINEYT